MPDAPVVMVCFGSERWIRPALPLSRGVGFLTFFEGLVRSWGSDHGR
jgi:hypothetical protein